ncbi:DUF1028 domain-containing protein [Actinomadura madurae]|uniref:DUF1028 domain-containing protein n=1 Tax=Actinomadura madurae TaxID=1993 RepID=UPI0020D20731|nr:DUF1028 domain-containing protein [Actinomadura madurae]MCP9950906.1 DUF1028 domain-containing protein [Actinomadura madurae]MCP9967695.1 DUF1028 domain-containing protein [Actinomadura madurae]MCP9980140.1 DUF1028 domain-containing protein [Actinomadura madurae]MCQ0008333.1 DUF1028 domain-containing protein [Actinomadura madurae]MCQ0016353.1 DUF1028 domain-containing protein [Actinomadura madurae]
MTFSIAARDEETGQLGVASASHAYGVGIADHARPGCGAVATQAFVEVSYGPRGLDLLGMGIAPQEALAALLSADPDREIRQVAFVGASGEIAHHTGARCVPSRGAVVAGTSIAIGNMLDNDRVLHAVSDAFNEGEGDLADRLVAGLEAGEKAGGDVRGRMSAALRVVSAEPAAGLWEGDLRVDYGADPLAALATNLRMSRAYDVFFTSVFAPGLVTGTEPVTGEALETALAGLRATQRALGDDMEPTVWQGVLLLRAGEEERGCELIARAIDTRPQFTRFVDGLARAGVIP